MHEVVFLEKAKVEISKALEWYKNISPDLEIDLKIEIRKYSNLIESNPLMYTYIFEDFRRVILKKFNYAIYYKIIDKKVVVFRFRHGKQNYF